MTDWNIYETVCEVEGHTPAPATEFHTCERCRTAYRLDDEGHLIELREFMST